MTVDLDLSKLISLITSKGFQIHPDALVLIEDSEQNVIQIIEEILEEKRMENGSNIIRSDDIKKALKHSYRSDIGKKYSQNDNPMNDIVSSFEVGNNITKNTKKSTLELVTNTKYNLND